MAISAFVELLGVRAGTGRSAGMPNTADAHSAVSVRVAQHVHAQLAVPERVLPEGTAGRAFERAVAAFLRGSLSDLARGRGWLVAEDSAISQFAQYRHLDELHELIQRDESGLLGASIGRDYVIKPDTTVALPGTDEHPTLHAAVSCKWTLRSDRAQNIRHEAVVMIRHRRGRLPHVVAVTAEPLPKRLASLAAGTGEVDCVYHPFLEELRLALDELGGDQQRLLHELVRQNRLRPLESLPAELVST
jgi:hypothetical protein